MSTLRGAHSLKTAILLILVLLAPLYFTLSQYTVFSIRNHDTGKIIYQKALRISDVFRLHYIHSVTNQPVDEYFYVKNHHTLGMKEMHYDSFGANLPVGPEKLRNETTHFSKEEDYYKVTYENREFELVPLRVGQVVANHTLIFSDQHRMPFLDIAPGGAYVEFYVSPF